MANPSIIGSEKITQRGKTGTLSYGERDPLTGTRYEEFTPDPVVAAPVTSPKPNAGDIYKGLIPSTDSTQDDAYKQYEDILKADTAPINEDEIRANTMNRFQAEIDALNRVYAEKKQEETVRGEGRLGSGAAIQARRGLIGSDFGDAQTEKVSDYNKSIQDSIDAEKAAKISSILTQARKDATDEIAAKTAARKAGAAEYIQFLNEAATRKTQRVADTIKNVLANGLAADENLFKELATQLGVTAEVIKAKYNEQKAVKDLADKEANPTETFEVDGVLYEKQDDGTYKAVTPAKQMGPITKVVGSGKNAVLYQYDEETDTWNPAVGAGSGLGSSSGSGNSGGNTYSGFNSSKISTVPATFEEYLASAQDKAGQSFSEQKVSQLRTQYDAAVASDAKASGVDLSKLSDTARSVYQNPSLIDNFTPTRKGKIIDELASVGIDLETFALNDVTAGQRDQLAQYDDLIRQGQEAEILLNEAKLNTGPIASTYQKVKAIGGGAQDFTQYRSIIDNMGSALLKLRSGAAVTPQEFERIKGFIPGVNDDEKTAATKITKFYEELEKARKNYATRATQSTQQILSSVQKAPAPSTTNKSTNTSSNSSSGQTSSGIKYTITQ